MKNKKIYITKEYEDDFIKYYNMVFCKKFNFKKIDEKKLKKIFNLAIKKGTWSDFAGYSKTFGEYDECGIHKIFLEDKTLTSYNDIIDYNSNYYNTNKADFMTDILHNMACVVEWITRIDENTCFGVYKSIKKILNMED